jgi:hypothetical protein
MGKNMVVFNYQGEKFVQFSVDNGETGKIKRDTTI